MKKILTGSQVYGHATEESDIDIVLLQKDAEELKDKLYRDIKGVHVYSTDEQKGCEAGFYFFVGKLKFNIIYAFDELDLKAWQFATKRMSKFPVIKNRIKRIENFRKIFDLFKRNEQN